MSRQKHTNLQQYKLLLEFLEKNPHIATASPLSAEGRVTVQNLWENQATILNAAGPPVNSADKWKKVWKDWKYKLRSKVAGNKIIRTGTGGGPSNEYYFTDLEERVLELINVRETMNGTGLSFGAPTEFQIVQENPSEPNLSSMINEEPRSSNTLNIFTTEVVQPQPTSSVRRKPMSKKSLLEKQVNMQEKWMKSINFKLKRICDQNREQNIYLKKNYLLKLKKFNYQKELDVKCLLSNSN